MVQPILFFALGFLCAGFLALLVAPAIWRRAVALTRRRIEASVPLTLSEIQADKDSLRAEFAMSLRKLEMNVKTFREKSAEQVVEIARSREVLTTLEGEHAAQGQKLTEFERADDQLKGQLRQREEQVKVLSEKLAGSEKVAGEGALELEKLGQMYEEASFAASNRQIELVARESQLEKLSDDVAAARAQHTQALRRHKELEVETRLAREALRGAEKKTAGLDSKIERLVATLADRDDKLDRREQDLARLREKSRDAGSVGEKAGNIDKAIAKLDAARERLEGRLAALAQENKKLKADIAQRAKPTVGAKEGEPGETSLLREQMHDLAAEVVNLTARLDGPDSPIAKALAVPQGEMPAAGEAGRMMSLAERVKALQKAAPAP